MLKKISIIAGFLLVIYCTLNLIDIFSRYHTDTSANSPSLEIGESFFTTNLIRPELHDFIYFEKEVDGIPYVWVKRIVAMPVDVVEIKNGTYY